METYQVKSLLLFIYMETYQVKSLLLFIYMETYQVKSILLFIYMETYQVKSLLLFIYIHANIPKRSDISCTCSSIRVDGLLPFLRLTEAFHTIITIDYFFKVKYAEGRHHITNYLFHPIRILSSIAEEKNAE